MTTETAARVIAHAGSDQTATTAQAYPQLLFFVSNDPDGGYVAKAPKYSIYTQGETWEELITNIKEAILCHFEEGEAPASFAWQMVKREVVTLRQEKDWWDLISDAEKQRIELGMQQAAEGKIVSHEVVRAETKKITIKNIPHA